MNTVLKSAVLSLTLLGTTLTALPAANAGDNWRHHRHHGGGGDLAVAGVLGLAVGAIVAGIATQPEPDYYEPGYREPVYREVRPRPRPHRVYDSGPDVVYLDGPILDPWSSEWYRYCEDTYRSFNPRTGTYVGYDGERHFCEAN